MRVKLGDRVRLGDWWRRGRTSPHRLRGRVGSVLREPADAVDAQICVLWDGLAAGQYFPPNALERVSH